MKRKLFSILLVVFLLAPFAGTYFFLHYQKKQVKRSIKWNMIAGLDKKELVLLKFTKEAKEKELKWEHSKEFEYKGEMYDVVDTKVISDTSYYWCWWDHEETKLNKKLQCLVNYALGHNPKENQKQKTVDLIFKLNFINSERVCYSYKDYTVNLPSIFYWNKTCLFPILNSESPPPEFC